MEPNSVVELAKIASGIVHDYPAGVTGLVVLAFFMGVGVLGLFWYMLHNTFANQRADRKLTEKRDELQANALVNIGEALKEMNTGYTDTANQCHDVQLKSIEAENTMSSAIKDMVKTNERFHSSISQQLGRIACAKEA